MIAQQTCGSALPPQQYPISNSLQFILSLSIGELPATCIDSVVCWHHQSSTIFRQAGASRREALIASFGFGLVNFVFVWPAIWTIDTFGYRSLLLFTFSQMAWSLLATGLCFLIPENSPAHLGLVTMSIYVFAALYSPGESPVLFICSAECFPLMHREIGLVCTIQWYQGIVLTYPQGCCTADHISSYALHFESS